MERFMPFKDPEKRAAYEVARRDDKNAKRRVVYAADPETAREYRKAYRAAHPEKYKAYREAHRTERAAYNKAYDAEHAAERAEYKKAYMKVYRAEHRDELKAYATRCNTAYSATHRAKRREYSKAWYAANHEEQIRRRAERRAGHRDEHRARRRADYTKNPVYYIENAAKRRAKVANAACEHPACLALGPVELAWQTSDHRCWMCGVTVSIGRGGNLHMDHVVPIARGGLHCAENLRPACGPCNRRKGSKTSAEFSHLETGSGVAASQ